MHEIKSNKSFVVDFLTNGGIAFILVSLLYFNAEQSTSIIDIFTESALFFIAPFKYGSLMPSNLCIAISLLVSFYGLSLLKARLVRFPLVSVVFIGWVGNCMLTLSGFA